MSDNKHMNLLIEKSHREVIRANDEMYYNEQKAKVQREQLETCLDYRDECLNGLKTAKNSGLSVVQVRECQLLVQYLDTVVETRQYKADICEERFEKSKRVWKKKQQHHSDLSETLNKQLIDEKIETDQVADDELNSRAAPKVKDTTNYKFKTLKR